MSDSRNFTLIFSYVTLFGIWVASYWYALPMSLNVVTTATLIVYIGSHRSLRLLATDAEVVASGGSADKKEVMSASDAYQFPFIGSAALFGLFLAFKFVPKDIITKIINVYFAGVSIFSVQTALSPMVETVLSSKRRFGFKRTLPVLGELDCTFNSAELVSFLPAGVFTWYYVKTKHFMMNNLLGMSFSMLTIQKISIGSYKIGAILLSGLFIYDIFWVFGSEKVFGSNVMVSVAKSFDGPIKLLFPRVLPGGSADAAGQVALAYITQFSAGTLSGISDVAVECSAYVTGDLAAALQTINTAETAKVVLTATREAAEAVSGGLGVVLKEKSCAELIFKVMTPVRHLCEGEFSLLGLGDIVIPGLFIAILLRFDAVQAKVKGLNGAHAVFPKPYFHWNIAFYALGLLVTLLVMVYFKAAQPALLYLVPACLLASAIAGGLQGSFSLLLAYNEEEPAGAPAPAGVEGPATLDAKKEQ